MVGKINLDAVVRRVDSTTTRIENSWDFPITIVAREDVIVEADGVEELLRFDSLQGTLEDLRAWKRAGRFNIFWGESAGRIDSIVLTRDFHKGAGIPVGTVVEARGLVVPQACRH